MQFDPRYSRPAQPPTPADDAEMWFAKFELLVHQLKDGADFLCRRLRLSQLSATDCLITLTLIERIYHDIETALGCRTAGDSRSTARLCDHVPGRLLRRCPWPACRLGSNAHQKPATGSAVGHDVRADPDNATEPRA